MQPRPLRGKRYASGANPDLVCAIRLELPYMPQVEADRFYATAMQNATHEEFALLGCNDRYFLLTCLLGRADIRHPWLYARCREVETSPDGHLDLWAREHRKSSIITFGGGIQEILADPEITIAIFSNNKKISEPFLRLIKNELENNTHLKDIYSDVLWKDPAKEAPGWSLKDGIIVKRKGNQKEATMEAHGIDALPTGRHFDLQIFDDVITERNVTNEDQIGHATIQFELADNLGRAELSRKWIIGTRYLFGDTYSTMMEKNVAKPRIYPATWDGTAETYKRGPDGNFIKGKDGKPVTNLVLLSPEAWEKKKRAQSTTLAAQMLQNPIAGQQNTFRVAWLRPYEVRPAVYNVYITVDPSLGQGKTSDRTAIAVMGIDSTGNKYLLDGYCHKMSLSERWQRLKELYRKWNSANGVQATKVGYERYGMQADVEYMKERMRLEKDCPNFEIEEVSWTRDGEQSKKARVGRLEPDFRNGHFFIPAKVWHPDAAKAENAGDDLKDMLTDRSIQGGVALWYLKPGSDDIFYRRYRGESLLETTVRRRGELYRLYDPIRRVDGDGNIYDLTRVFMLEYRFFPFEARKDLVDAMSRIYDLEPIHAGLSENLEEPDYPDS